MTLLTLLLAAATGTAAVQPRVDAVLQAFDVTIVQKRLAQMVELDQYARKFDGTTARGSFNAAEDQYFSSQMGQRWNAIDTANTNEIKALIKRHGWFKISAFGGEADGNAWLLVQHADLDPDFQKEVLMLLEPLVAQGETNKQNFAFLHDRVNLSASDPSKQRPQRYGTQGHCIGKGQWEPHPVEDPKNLEARRANVGLSTMAEYVKLFKDICRRDERQKN